MYIPILGAFLEATAMTLEKEVMKKKKVNYKNYTVYGFLAIVLVMLPFAFFFWKIDNEALETKNLLIFFSIVFISILANILTYYSLKRENLSVLEPVRMLQPLFTILLAVILYSSERKLSVFVLAIIASIALISGHIKKHHLVYDKYIIAALFGSLFFAIELVMSKSILSYYNSFTFYFLRCLMIFLITLAIFRPKVSMDKKTKFMICIIAIIWVSFRIIMYYGYEAYGIVFTTIMFILTPVFIFIFAKIFLKEKITIRHIISAIIIVVCVVLAVILENAF
ncbi:MAG: DMT family transporter [Nanoarchaeota archaeon]|nr:DMT family transporter [Nanoarchaeota archaeon]